MIRREKSFRNNNTPGRHGPMLAGNPLQAAEF